MITNFICFLLFCIMFLFCKEEQNISGGAHNKTKNKNKTKDQIKDLSKYPRSKSEAEIIKIAENILDCKMPTVNPSWLVWEGHTLELDGYCADKQVALEFSGPLHTKWYPDKESYIKYYKRITNDVVKRKLCKQKKVLLIQVDMRLPREHWRDYILSRLSDIGKAEKPINYILKQKEKPFRNKQLERELGLNSYSLAKHL